MRSPAIRNSKPAAESGQATVEFTLCFILFLLFIFLIVEGGRMIFYSDTVSHVAREGARFAIVRGSSSSCGTGCPATATDIESFVKARAVGVAIKQVDVCWWTTGACDPANPHKASNKGPGSIVRVKVVSDFDPVAPIIPQGIVTLTSTTQMVISQ
jgi:Flp pilus assembly protein TadG